MRDFTLKKYTQLLKVLKSRGFFFMSFDEYIQNSKDKFVLLRHDVDKLPVNSIKTARIENKLGIKGTYYFRIFPESYDENIIKQIADLGHEIGYHYENLSTCGGDLRLAIDDFRINLEKFRKIYPVKTICMHGSPLSKYDNRLLWEKYDYQDFGIIGEPYFDVDFSEALYLTDTGRCWNGDNFSVRDKVTKRRSDLGIKGLRDNFEDGRMEEKNRRTKRLGDEETRGNKVAYPSGTGVACGSLQERFRFRSTQDIIDAAEGGFLQDRIMITVHPQRWGDSLLPWAKELVWQNFKNVVKWGMIKSRK